MAAQVIPIRKRRMRAAVGAAPAPAPPSLMGQLIVAVASALIVALLLRDNKRRR